MDRRFDAGADASATIATGKTALDFAAEKGHAAVAELLRERGAASK